MSKSLYLINPKADFQGYYTGEVFEGSGLAPMVTIADLATTTVAAMAPDDFDIEICEGHIAPVNFDHPADFVGITGKSTQYGSMIDTAQKFQARGKKVIIGGPLASLDPDSVRPYCDILVEGEMEDIAEEFFSDLLADTWKNHYRGTRPDLADSPIPRWDLYPNDKAAIGAVQTSRGCPFECEFCDVIQYLGRKQRHKQPHQVIEELDVLYGLGYRIVFLSDDNFTVYRRRAKELLVALREWNEKQTQGHMTFYTQLSIDAALDEEILKMCASAGLTNVFIGIETPNEESLKESGKRQNLTNSGGTLQEKIELIVANGIMVMGGMIVGFDHDDQGIFDMQYRFAMQTPVPLYHLNALMAPTATPLHARMKKDGRLIDWEEGKGAGGTPWMTNIIPKQLTHEELREGIRWLGNNLYSPDAFGERMLNMIELHGSALESIPFSNYSGSRLLRPVAEDSVKLVRQFPRLGTEEAKAWGQIGKAVAKKPWLSTSVMGLITMYMQIRYMYDNGRIWDPILVNTKLDLSHCVSNTISPDEIKTTS